MKFMNSVGKRMARIAALLLLIVSASLWFSPAPAQAYVPDQIITSFYNSATYGGPEVFCGNGDPNIPPFSVRSFDGELCKNSRAIAALAEYVCTNTPRAGEFQSSICHQAAVQNLDGAEPLEVLKEEFVKELGKVGGNPYDSELLMLIKRLVPFL